MAPHCASRWVLRLQGCLPPGAWVQSFSGRGRSPTLEQAVCSPPRRLRHPCEPAASQTLVLPALIFYPFMFVPGSEPGPGAMEMDEVPSPPSRRLSCIRNLVHQPKVTGRAGLQVRGVTSRGGRFPTWDSGPLLLQAASSQQPLSIHPAQVVDQPCLELDDPGVPGQPLILFRSVLMAASWGLLDPFSGLPALKHLASISVHPSTPPSIWCRAETQRGRPERTDG